jgi:hypothetical protein
MSKEKLWYARSAKLGQPALIFRAKTFRAGLLRELRRKHADKIYWDPGAKHVGYIVAGDWWDGYELIPLCKAQP